MFTASGLEVHKLSTDQLTPAVERWLANSQTPPAEAAQVRKMIEADEARDLSGTRPFRVDGELFFNQKMVTIVGRKMKHWGR